jgi:hypothetical protein
MPNPIKTIRNENKFLFSKTPQILVFNNDNSVNIIKSKVKNTRIHLPRPNYEASITKNSDLDRQISLLKNCECIKESEVRELCNTARDILLDESNI